MKKLLGMYPYGALGMKWSSSAIGTMGIMVPNDKSSAL
jgi:hypothetical protein